jgi:hypothetical protein
MKLNRLAVPVGLAIALMAGSEQLLAQQDQGGGQRGQRGQGGPGGRGGFDPAEMQARVMQNIREQLVVKDDAEWKIIEARIVKVNEARREVGAGGGGMRMMFRRPGGDNQGQGGDQGGRRGGPGGFGGQQSAEEQALQKAIDSKATKDELKVVMAKYRESRKAKEAALEKAQDELKQVLSVQQEAIALAMGLIR